MNVLMHAAAGGVGLILCQWANHLGANVIGTVGSKEKAALAKANGCHHTILYRDEDFVARVKEITGGKLCDVVYDGIGKTTFPASLDCIRPLGMFVSFGSASGQIDAFNINILQAKGSLFATRPTLNTYAAKREDLLAIANDLFDVVGERRGQNSGQPEIRAARRGEGAPRSRRPRHHRLVDPGALEVICHGFASQAAPNDMPQPLDDERCLGLLGDVGLGGARLFGGAIRRLRRAAAGWQRATWHSILLNAVRRHRSSRSFIVSPTRSRSASLALAARLARGRSGGISGADLAARARRRTRRRVVSSC